MIDRRYGLYYSKVNTSGRNLQIPPLGQPGYTRRPNSIAPRRVINPRVSARDGNSRIAVRMTTKYYILTIMSKLILLRHGQSAWNLENRFTGWTDVDLSDKGRAEAFEAGKLMASAGLKPRYCFTSYLKRAIHTLDLALDAMDRTWVPVVKDWHLNERHYGALQGLNKADTAAKFGAEQVHIWRRSYDVAPPALTPDDARYPGNDERYSALSADELPLTESLALTVSRVRPCWEELIVPALRLYDTVLVAAHGNSLRAMVMMLKKLTPEQIVAEEIPTGRTRLLSLGDRLNLLSDSYL